MLLPLILNPVGKPVALYVILEPNALLALNPMLLIAVPVYSV